MKQKALCGALSLKAKHDLVVGLKAYTAEAPKTKEIAIFLQSVEINKKVLFVLPEQHDVLEKSCRNIATINYTTASKLNAYDVMSSKHVLFVANAYDVLEKRLTK
jgi:large subunit ribosomal protein L4